MGYFLDLSPACLMIKIWEYSYHVHHFLLLIRVVVIAVLIWTCVLMLSEKFMTMKTIFTSTVLFINFNFIEKNIFV